MTIADPEADQMMIKNPEQKLRACLIWRPPALLPALLTLTLAAFLFG